MEASITAPDPLTNFLAQQRFSIIRELDEDMTRCLIATTYERLNSHANLYGWTLVPLQGIRKRGAAFVLRKTGRAGQHFEPQLWVDVEYRGWRTAFRRFLREHYGIRLKNIPDRWHVDHLLSRHRFANGAPKYLIRLFLLDGSINTAFGAGFERRFFTQERRREPIGGFHLDWITFLKAWGERLPSIELGPLRWAEWAWDIAGKLEKAGLDDQVSNYDGISTVLNLGYSGEYAPLPLPPTLYKVAMQQPSFQCFPDLREADK